MWYGLSFAEALVLGVFIGASLTALLVAWLVVHLTRGWDHPLSEEEIKEHLGEVWHP